MPLTGSGNDLTTAAASSGPEVRPVGDSALVIELGDAIDPALNQRVHALARALTDRPLAGVLELVPTYRSLLVRYDPLFLAYAELLAWVRELGSDPPPINPAAVRLVEVPTYYGGAGGFDLDEVAGQCGLTAAEVVRRHSAVEYTVYMMGFTPGYPYLGRLDPALAVPRLASPRKRVPAGSVGIAGLQSGIYPVDSPGGWRIIGWTPLTLFAPAREPHFAFEPGDRVRFVPAIADLP